MTIGKVKKGKLFWTNYQKFLLEFKHILATEKKIIIHIPKIRDISAKVITLQLGDLSVPQALQPYSLHTVLYNSIILTW